MKRLSFILATLLLLVGLVALNDLAGQLPLRADLTAARNYTLSPGSRALLGRLEEPVQLDFYFSRSVEGLPISFKNYATRVEEMLRQYVREGRGQVRLRVIDPKPDTPAEEQATAAGLTPQTTPQGDAVYLGLAVTQAEAQKSIPFFAQSREPFLEYDISQLIHAVQQLSRPKVGLLSGVPLRTPMDPQAMQVGEQLPPDQFVIGEWSQSAELVTVESSAETLPANLDALVIVHPRNLSPALQFAIDQFVLAGKPVLVAVDPVARHAPAENPMMAQFGGAGMGGTSSLPDLFRSWGLTYDDKKVVADTELATPVQERSGQVNRLPSWLSLAAANLNRSSAAVAQLKSLLFVDAGAIAALPGTKATFTPLVETTAQAGLVDGMSLQFGDPEAASGKLTSPGKKVLAALVQGKFKTAFPGGAPKTAPETKSGESGKASETKGPAASFLTESKGTSTVVVVADTDWLFDDYSVRRLNFLGSQAAQPINDNLAFATNLLDFLVGSPDLISLRGKGSAQRPFTVVRRMEAEAQRKYQQQLDVLETRIAEVQSKLAALHGKAGEGNRLVATPEARRAIEEFQQQQLAMRAERRQIRAALREGIEALGTRLLLLNLLVPVGLVAGFGLWFYRRRRST
ncbi:MAG: GldG family protein [Verrucomicrobia bacterium]|nr:GldG family protein [Verrucomicrobiota bacterium]